MGPGVEMGSGEVGLTPVLARAARAAYRLIGRFNDDGDSLCCACGVTAAEAIRRLDGTVIEYTEQEDPDCYDDNLVVGITDVPGGCVVGQRYGFAASTPGLSGRLSAGTVCYAMYANPKSGNRGHIMRDRVAVGWDLHPGGGWSAAIEPAGEILRTYLFRGHAVAYCCTRV
jgi:hypothetical protein